MIAPARETTSLRLYTAMLRIRRVEEAIAARYAAQEMRCPVHLSIGQEAVAVGVSAGIEPGDYAFSTHRAHAHYLAKGGSLEAFLAEIHGKDAGCCSGRGGSMHVIDLEANFLGATPIVGSSLPVGVGAAFGSVMLGQDRVTVIYFGDGSTEEGVFSEALNFAALKSLPVLFVCENNLYSVYSSLDVRQPKGRDNVAVAKAHGVRALRDDGNDVRRVMELTREAADIARAGGGPSFLEFSTYRWLEHCGPNWDNDLGYRSPAEFEAWRERCPVDRLATSLTASGELDASAIATIEAEIATEIDAAFTFARNAPYPTENRLLVDEYASPLS